MKMKMHKYVKHYMKGLSVSLITKIAYSIIMSQKIDDKSNAYGIATESSD